MKNKILLTLTAGTAAIALLAGCSSSSKSTGSGSQASPAAAGSGSSAASDYAAQLAQYLSIPTKIPLTTPLSKKPPTGEKVVFLQNGQTPGQQYSAALKAAVAPLGWTEQDINFDASNPAAVGSAFQTAVNGGANVIAVQGLDSALYAKYVPAAQAKHIVVVDDVTSGTKIPGVTYVDRSDASSKPQAQIAVTAILADAQKRNVTPHVLNVSSVLLTSILTPFINDVTADLKAANCGSCDNQTYNLSAQATISNSVAAPVVSYLQTHPKINYIVVTNGAFGLGLLQAIKQAGLGTSIRLIGATPLPPEIADLKAGNDPQVLGWIANSITVVGWMAVDAAARVLVGDDPSAYASLASPTWLLTSASGSALVPSPVAPLDYVDQFKALWLLQS